MAKKRSKNTRKTKSALLISKKTGQASKLWIPSKKVLFVLLGAVFLIAIESFIFFSGKKTFQTKVMVFTMFEKESKPWVSYEKLPLDFKVDGAYSDVHCNTEGLCVATTGETKAQTAQSVTAILLNSQFSFKKAYFISSGIAGTPPSKGTLGFAAWSRWIIDWDQGSHLLQETAPQIPFGFLPNPDSKNAVYHLNEKLVETAYHVTSSLQLQDNQEAITARYKYPDQMGKRPYVAICDTVSGDDFWAGETLSNEAQYITDKLTNNQGTYCTTEQEDVATAMVLKKFGYLDKYLSLRTASDFDQPYPGEPIGNLFNSFPGETIAINNAYLVGSTMAHYLINHFQ